MSDALVEAVVVCGMCGRYQKVLTNQEWSMDIGTQFFKSITESCQYAMTLHHNGQHSDGYCELFTCAVVERGREREAKKSLNIGFVKGGEAREPHA